MSQESVIQVIQKALVEPDFRTTLLNEPATVLKGYDLTEQESQALGSIKKEVFDAFASEVEQRISKSGIAFDAGISKEPAIFQDTSFFSNIFFRNLK
jgi:hypothetical protein